MKITGIAVCDKCGQEIYVDSESFYSCDENHFSVKIGDCSDTYKTDEGRGLYYKVIDRKYYYTQDDFIELDEECFEIIANIEKLGVKVRLPEKKSDDGKHFIESIYSDIYDFNSDKEQTELDLTIYLDKSFGTSKNVEMVKNRLKSYHEIINKIKNENLDINDRYKIEELDLHVDGEERRHKLYDVVYYF